MDWVCIVRGTWSCEIYAEKPDLEPKFTKLSKDWVSTRAVVGVRRPKPPDACPC